MFEEISRAVQERGHSEPSEVEQVATFAQQNGSAVAFAMVGDLIQLLDDCNHYDLSDAENAYLRAVAIDPMYAEGYTSLGHFYDAVMDDPERARTFFEKAIDLGDESAAEVLQAVIDQLNDV